MIFNTPLKESKGFVRTSQRTPTDINATIIRLKPKEVTGSGAIINVSDGGCAFTTDAVLQVDDEIELLILLSVKNVEREYRIHGTIQNTRTVKSKDEITNYGIQCVDDRKILVEIKKFVENQKAGKEHKTTK
ncbi:MAG: PilZ domain-containing protein [Nitrospinota bacterium]